MKLIQGDCLEVMKDIPDKSIDMILCDLPYGTTKCKWDIIIPFELLWEQYKRIIKDNGAIVLFSIQPFTSSLITSNLAMFRQELIFEKCRGSNPFSAGKQFLKVHENICVFYKKPPTFNPQKWVIGERFIERRNKLTQENFSFNAMGIENKVRNRRKDDGVRFADSILSFTQKGKILHPTQKPVELLEYLIKTYTNEGNVVLDNCMGSGSTGVACKNTNRDFIGIELDEKYFNIAKSRIELC